jgi:alkylation response protein AidB-like acyl-CoA dehydrogenase
MSELSPRLATLRRQGREWAGDLRDHAFAASHDPSTAARIADLPLLSVLARLPAPAAFGGVPLIIDGEQYNLASALERAVFLEEAAWGDLGLVLSAPGSLLAGAMVEELADETQREWFYERLLRERTWTFLAMTEPGHGSDGAGLRTALSTDPAGDGYLLTGEKRYVGNATRGRIGVAVARTAPGPLGICSVLVDGPAGGFSAAPIRTVGLDGVLGSLVFDAVPIPADRLLGRHLPASRRGILGWTRAFTVLRVIVAAMAVGLSQAALDYVRTHRSMLRSDERQRLGLFSARIESLRALIRHAAAAIDAGSEPGPLASAVKLRAAGLAEEVTLGALAFFGPGARLEHPLLDKWARDARGVECMEGTSNIQRMVVAGALLRGAIGPLSAVDRTPATLYQEAHV